jgi:hypothetical protein
MLMRLRMIRMNEPKQPVFLHILLTFADEICAVFFVLLSIALGKRLVWLLLACCLEAGR